MGKKRCVRDEAEGRANESEGGDIKVTAGAGELWDDGFGWSECCRGRQSSASVLLSTVAVKAASL